MTKKIYLYCVPIERWGPDDVIGYALAEDGTGLASHLSSGPEWAKHDMGYTSNWKHEHYAKHYPDGYELEWVDDPESNADVMAAVKLNKEKHQERGL